MLQLLLSENINTYIFVSYGLDSSLRCVLHPTECFQMYFWYFIDRYLKINTLNEYIINNVVLERTLQKLLLFGYKNALSLNYSMW